MMINVCLPENQCIVPPSEGTLSGNHLLISASCIAEEFPDTYRQLIEGKESLMGCPLQQSGLKLTKKIKMLIELREIKKITLAMTEKTCEPCLRDAVREAVKQSSKKILVEYLLVDRDGMISL